MLPPPRLFHGPQTGWDRAPRVPRTRCDDVPRPAPACCPARVIVPLLGARSRRSAGTSGGRRNSGPTPWRGSGIARRSVQIQRVDPACVTRVDCRQPRQISPDRQRHVTVLRGLPAAEPSRQVDPIPSILRSSAVVCHSTPVSSKSLSFDHTGRLRASARASTWTSSGSRLPIRRLAVESLL